MLVNISEKAYLFNSNIVVAVYLRRLLATHVRWKHFEPAALTQQLAAETSNELLESKKLEVPKEGGDKQIVWPGKVDRG